MVKTISPKPSVKGLQIGIIVSRFNEMVTSRLLSGCLKELKRLGFQESQLTVVQVPGSFEIPVAALRLAKRRTIDAVICLGAVIRGETLHFELIAHGVALGISQVALSTGKPVIFGVLSTDTIEQAYKRSDDKGDHKGREAAHNAVEMVNLLRDLK